MPSAIILADSNHRRQRATRLRAHVLSGQYPQEFYIDGHDARADFFLLHLGDHRGKLIGALRYRAEGGTGFIEHISILPEYQRRRFGSDLVQRTITRLEAETTVARILAPILVHIQPFYARLEFEPFGEPFVQAGVPQISMIHSI